MGDGLEIENDPNTLRIGELCSDFSKITSLRDMVDEEEDEKERLKKEEVILDFVTLQSFIGHSQNGMNSLERRVDGLEKAIDVMCSALAISTGKIADIDATENTYCLVQNS